MGNRSLKAFKNLPFNSCLSLYPIVLPAPITVVSEKLAILKVLPTYIMSDGEIHYPHVTDEDLRHGEITGVVQDPTESL